MIIRVNIDDAVSDRLLRANAKFRGWTARVPAPEIGPDATKDNPLNRRQFVEQQIVDFLMQPLEAEEAAEAAQLAAKAARDKARAEVKITIN